MSNTPQAVIWISAASPLLTYSTSKTGSPGASWMQLADGSSQCQGQNDFSIELADFYFTNVAFDYSPSANYQIKTGLDGSVQANSAQSGNAGVSAEFGTHTARLECKAEGSEGFTFQGVQVQTQVMGSGSATNVTLDDASQQITYTGFQSTSATQSDISAIQSGSFYDETVSYTSLGGASAKFQCQGSAFYIFGMTGPGFGAYQVEVDAKVAGTYNATTTVETYNTLLYFTTYLDSSKAHQISITNQNDGLLFALDYVVCVGQGQDGDNSSRGQGSPTVTAASSGATAVFPSQGSSPYQTGTGDSGGAVIGGVLGTLASLFLLWVLWRYRVWKKEGGEGSFLAALCGGLRVKKEPKKEENKFHLWPMVWSRPKYDT
ncbi:hypothetical protein I302_103562 [Kwoniella bestiolae CBS 10118]|uniref:Uncharacterized protein n=1 Tax=Kwoniella bestiolae CBS 10118 TaxID=1296100 RepID=A0A1B9G8U7_9TREE|nr:hypothetical protein I302_02263 [Kwoniella bestiolae CBS 10118]OCF27421.1 hypothetical protein I302_02263 [Kwoniella bestiolae CBS 10118]